ncbi:hypothetical protein ACVWWN_006833 [Mycobacterium sp. URHB0021]
MCMSRLRSDVDLVVFTNKGVIVLALKDTELAGLIAASGILDS